ncbi:MAG: hypothetical protein RMK29_17565 [Myxococcales bacterium]|nr:hypothetical protein [Myxococcota bacterium]MDW8283519.1 hypothetical protein [Myxococcales bacterium]
MHRPPLWLLLLAACSGRSLPSSPDLAAPVRGPAGLLEDCLPGTDEGICAEGLRCSLVQAGEPGYQGFLTQCVPQVASPLPEDAPCAFSEQAPQPTGAVPKRYDRCAPGAGCVQTTAGPRCRTLCALRVPGQCGPDRLCVLPSPVSAIGFCAASDRCQPVAPQSGCPAGPDGRPLACYVFTESKQDDRDPAGGTFCLAPNPLGDSTGALGSRCERSAHCQAGLSCVAVPGERQPSCRPYCSLPPADGGIPDGGLPCQGDLGTCHPIPFYDRVGRCY